MKALIWVSSFLLLIGLVVTDGWARRESLTPEQKSQLEKIQSVLVDVLAIADKGALDAEPLRQVVITRLKEFGYTVTTDNGQPSGSSASRAEYNRFAEYGQSGSTRQSRHRSAAPAGFSAGRKWLSPPNELTRRAGCPARYSSQSRSWHDLASSIGDELAVSATGHGRTSARGATSRPAPGAGC